MTNGILTMISFLKEKLDRSASFFCFAAIYSDKLALFVTPTLILFYGTRLYA